MKKGAIIQNFKDTHIYKDIMEIVETKVFVSSISERQFVDGLRYSNDELNKKMMEGFKKKYFKKNGKPRKGSPYNVLPLTPKEYLESKTN